MEEEKNYYSNYLLPQQNFENLLNEDKDNECSNNFL